MAKTVRTTKKPKATAKGRSSIKSKQSWLSWKFAVPLIVLVGMVGGLFVYRSSASTNEQVWLPGNQYVTLTGNIKLQQKSNGWKYWAIEQSRKPVPSCIKGNECDTNQSNGLIPLGTITLNNSMTSPGTVTQGSSSGVYCALVNTEARSVTVRFAGSAVYTNGEINPGSQQAPIPPVTVHPNTKQEVCVNADISKGALGFNFSETYSDAWHKPATKVSVLELFRKKPKEPVATQQFYKTKAACEQASGKTCRGPLLCDYVPTGKTVEEVCGKGFFAGAFTPIITQ